MPELPTATGPQRAALAGATRIAVPGCYPTAVSLALAPGLVAGVLEPDDITVVAASGTSGAGRSLKPHLLGAEVMGAMSPYGVGGVHRHTPEIEQNLTAAGGRPGHRLVHARPSRRCRAASSPPAPPGCAPAPPPQPCARPGPPPTPTSRSCTCCPRAAGRSTGSVLGSNAVHLQVVLDERVGRVVVVAAVDNLTKGTAGAAVQCLNLALGLPETTGLPIAGVAP